jgi:hypothetical protein
MTTTGDASAGAGKSSRWRHPGEPAPGSAPSRGTDRRPGHGVFGSWRFIVVQTMIVTASIALNLLVVAYRWDPYPFILLTELSRDL